MRDMPLMNYEGFDCFSDETLGFDRVAFERAIICEVISVRSRRPSPRSIADRATIDRIQPPTFEIHAQPSPASTVGRREGAIILTRHDVVGQVSAAVVGKGQLFVTSRQSSRSARTGA